jgi:hypothetical protein
LDLPHNSTIAWSFSKGQVRNHNLFHKIGAKVLLLMVYGFICLILISYSLTQICREFDETSSKLTSTEISNLLWSYGKAEVN